MAIGKSSIAQKYRSFEAKMAWIKVDHFKDLFDHFEKEARPYSHGAANATLEYLLKEGFSVVMEGVFQNPVFVKQAAEVADKYTITCRIFELKASLITLQRRDKVRDEVKSGCRQPLGDEAIAKIFQKLENTPIPEAIVLNTEKLSVVESLEFIDSHFKF